MNTDRSAAIAELADKIMQRMAYIMLSLASVLLISAWQRVAAEPLAGHLERLEKGFAIVFLIIIAVSIIPVMWQKIALKLEREPFQIESFITGIAQKAFSIGWIVTLISIPILKVVIKKFVPELPVASVFEIIQAVLMGAYSISFLILNRGAGYMEAPEELPGK